MLVENYIKNLLFEYDCVVIPELGGFITRQHPANIHPITNRFLPPSKGIAFNEQLKVNDGLLISSISREENIERESAVKLVNDYVHFVSEKLKSAKQYFLKDIGKIFYNPENNLEFEPYDKINYLEDSFGLTELFFKPIERNFNEMSKIPPRVVRPIAKKRPATVKSQPKKIKDVQIDEFGDETKSSQGFKAIYFLPLILLMASAIGLFYLNKTGKSLATMVPGTTIAEEKSRPVNVDTLNSIANTSSETPEDPQAEFNTEENNSVESDRSEAIAPSSNNAPKKGQYYIVIGSFGVEKNANKLKRKIAAEGGSPIVIAPSGDSKFYKVAVAAHDHLPKAVQQMEELRGTYGNSIWVLTY